MKFYIGFGVVAILAFVTLIILGPADSPTQSPRSDHVIEVTPQEYNQADGGWSYLLDASGNIKLSTVLLAKNPLESAHSQDTLDSSSGGYIGSQACGECHQDNYNSFLETAHFKTSSEPSQATIRGSFAPGKNRLETRTPNLSFEMLDEGGQFIQRILSTNKNNRTRSLQVVADVPFGLVTGSGKIGQTYLHWQGDYLYQQHVSYLSGLDAWANSPGLEDGTAVYARPVGAKCLECHSTYFQAIEGTPNKFRKENYLLGVGCEKCHGRGRAHVEFHRQNPNEQTPYAIVQPGKLTASLALDTCRLCHGGIPKGTKQPSFSYQPGESLDDYFEFEVTSDETSGIHSNTQLPRLLESKCFTNSESMTCTDCHNPHQHERNDLALFSSRCIQCHEIQQCGKFELLGTEIRKNCIDCHMPQKDLMDTQSNSQRKQDGPKMRDHLIKVYEKATQEYLDSR